MYSRERSIVECLIQNMTDAGKCVVVLSLAEPPTILILQYLY